MPLSLTLACFWMFVACVLAMFPSRDKHWRLAYVLIAAGLPILAYVFIETGGITGLIVLAAGMSILRWPVVYFARWVRKGFQR